MQLTEIPIEEITIGEKRRKTTPSKVKALAESITETGLQHPIGVNESNRLIHGRHRMEACKSLGWKVIPAVVHKLDDIHAEMAEIDENILRNQLTALEESKAVARRKELYEAIHPETKPVAERGGPGRGNKTMAIMATVSFADDTAAKTGRGSRTIRRDAEIGEKITESAAVQIQGTKVANNKTQLKQLADLPEKEQEKAAKLIGSGKAKTVEDAIEAGKKKSRNGKPVIDSRKFKAFEQEIGKCIRMNTDLRKHCNGKGAAESETIRKHFNDALKELATWRRSTSV